MARPEDHLPRAIEEALAELKRDPTHPVHARVDDLGVELRVVPDTVGAMGDDILGGAGPWKGESTEQLLEVLSQARERDDRDVHQS